MGAIKGDTGSLDHKIHIGFGFLGGFRVLVVQCFGNLGCRFEVIGWEDSYYTYN